MQSLGKDAFSTELEVIVQAISENYLLVAPDAKTLNDYFQDIFQKESLDFKKLWAEAETEEERRFNQPLFQLYFP